VIAIAWVILKYSVIHGHSDKKSNQTFQQQTVNKQIFVIIY